MNRLNFYVDITDEQLDSFLARMGRGATTAVAVSSDGDDENDNTPAPNAGDPNARDAAGIPWIAGIHASTKGQTKEGFWRGAKGVTAEQRAAAEAPYKAATPPTFQTGNNPPITIPAMPMPGAIPAMPIPEAAKPPVTYPDIVNKFQALVAAGNVTPDYVSATLYPAADADPIGLQTDESMRRRLMDQFDKFG